VSGGGSVGIDVSALNAQPGTGGRLSWANVVVKAERSGCMCEGAFDFEIADEDRDGLSDALDNCDTVYNPLQEEHYPPVGNGCGDACDCEADIEPPNGDGDVDGSDAYKFKQDFFRFNCSNQNRCDGDFECDKDVDGSDAFRFKKDFFRPNCPTNCNPRGSANWCVYQ